MTAHVAVVHGGVVHVGVIHVCVVHSDGEISGYSLMDANRRGFEEAIEKRSSRFGLRLLMFEKEGLRGPKGSGCDTAVGGRMVSHQLGVVSDKIRGLRGEGGYVVVG